MEDECWCTCHGCCIPEDSWCFDCETFHNPYAIDQYELEENEVE